MQSLFSLQVYRETVILLKTTGQLESNFAQIVLGDRLPLSSNLSVLSEILASAGACFSNTVKSV